MEETEKDRSPDTEVLAEATEAQGTELIPEVKSEEKAGEAPHEGNALAEKRGRLVAGGIAATVVLSVVALLVFGIFQLTGWWRVVCPTDLPVNDPAPLLWKVVTSDQPGAHSLGVTGGIAEEAAYKRPEAGPSEAPAGKEQK
jgi:hypothetical protein